MLEDKPQDLLGIIAINYGFVKRYGMGILRLECKNVASKITKSGSEAKHTFEVASELTQRTISSGS